MKKTHSSEQLATQTHLNTGVDANSSITPGSAENIDDLDPSTEHTDLSESGVTRRDGRCRKILDIIG